MTTQATGFFERWASRGVLAFSVGALGLGVFVSLPSAADEAGGSITGEVSARAPKNRAGVVVSLEKVAGTFRPPAKQSEMNQKGMKFVPHVMGVLKGGTVKFTNDDSVRHNVFTPDGEQYNLGTWAKGESKTYTFKSTGVYHQLCNVHPEMGAVVVVLDNPYFAVTGDDGKFHIDGVPPGTYTLKTWSEKLGESKKEITVAAGAPAVVKLAIGK